MVDVGQLMGPEIRSVGKMLIDFGWLIFSSLVGNLLSVGCLVLVHCCWLLNLVARKSDGHAYVPAAAGFNGMRLYLFMAELTCRI